MGDKAELKRLIRLTKDTDSFYLGRRNISEEYDPTGAYEFTSWKDCFDSSIRTTYEHLHENLLYTNEKQDFDKAIETFTEINKLLESIGE